MTRTKKMLLTSSSSILYQLIALICGFILPKLILSTYGSAVNGLVSSITQFLGIISLCEMGVGAVVQSSLFKPLAEGDGESISKITVSAERFFRKIALLLVIYTAVLMPIYPLVVIGEFDYLYTLFLILVISISSFAQYYFGMTYRLLLSADQLGFINFSIRSATLILNTAMCVLLIRLGASIHIVKLATSTLFLLQPLSIAFIAKRKYKINRRVVITEEPIKQKWNGLAQHVATVVHGNVPTFVLTLLSSLENVSIFAVYNLVVSGIKTFVTSLTDGMYSMIGNMLAKGESEELSSTFDVFEWVMHTVVTVIFSLMGVLIVPFIAVYTNGLTDANYIVPAFAYLIVIAEAIYCLRLPYNIVVLSAGHYKQTQTSSFIEAGINIAVSVALVFVFGLAGVAIGTLCAMLYRTLYLVWYLSKNIIHRKGRYFIKHIFVDILCASTLILPVCLLPDFFSMQTVSYLGWLGFAAKAGIVALPSALLINLILYPNITRRATAAFVKKLSRRRNAT